MSGEEWFRLGAAAVFLWAAAIQDLKTKKIPILLPAAFLAGAVAVNLLFPTGMDRRELWAGVVPGALLLVPSPLAKGKIGEGDGVCLLVCGLYTGLRRTVRIAETAFVLAGIAAAALLLTKGRRAEESFPFVPFLAVGATLVLLYGGLARRSF